MWGRGKVENEGVGGGGGGRGCGRGELVLKKNWSGLSEFDSRTDLVTSSHLSVHWYQNEDSHTAMTLL